MDILTRWWKQGKGHYASILSTGFGFIQNPAKIRKLNDSLSWLQHNFICTGQSKMSQSPLAYFFIKHVVKSVLIMNHPALYIFASDLPTNSCIR